jgi:hypothetical protein
MNLNSIPKLIFTHKIPDTYPYQWFTFYRSGKRKNIELHKHNSFHYFHSFIELRFFCHPRKLHRGES